MYENIEQVPIDHKRKVLLQNCCLKLIEKAKISLKQVFRKKELQD